MHNGAESEERGAGVGEWRVGVRSGDRKAESGELRAKSGEHRAEARRHRAETEGNRVETEAEIKAETGRQILKTQSGYLSHAWRGDTV